MSTLPPVSYPTDLTDREWALLEPLLPPAKPGGRPRSVHLRVILNGLLYVLRSGCQWRLLPRTYGPWSYRVSLLPSVAPPGRVGTPPCCLAWPTAAAKRA
jgi:transposase